MTSNTETDEPRKMICIQCDNEALKDSDYCAECENKAFQKIGGWLYLPALGILLTIIVNLIGASNTLGILLEHYSSLYSAAKGILFFEVFAHIGMVGLAIYVGSLFFRKKRALPRYYIILLLCSLGYLIIDLMLGYHLMDIALNKENVSPVLRNLVSAVIWGSYFRVSVRVKRTFVH